MEFSEVLPYISTVLGSLATIMATWHFKGKDALKRELHQATLDIRTLKANQKSDRELLTQKMNSVETELRDMKDSVKEDIGEIKTAIVTLNATVMQLAVSTGELSGSIKHD